MLVESKKKAKRLNSIRGTQRFTRPSQANGTANIPIKIEEAIPKLENLAQKYIGITNPHGFLTDLRNALGIPDKQGASKYGVVAIPKPDGSVLQASLRVTNHNSNAETYITHNANYEYNLSIMVRKNFNKNTFKPHDDVRLDEYVYFGKRMEQVENPLTQIVNSIIGFLKDGEYKDTTGIAMKHISPQQANNKENNQEIKENRNMNKKKSIRLFERIAGEKGMNDAEVMRRRNDNFIKDMDSVPNSLWDNPYEPNYGDSVEMNGWFETPEETQLKVARDRLNRHRLTQNHITNNEEIKENRNMNKKQVIRINESQLRQIVTESVKRVLNEDKPPFLDSELATGDHERCANYRVTSIIREFTLKLRQAIIDDEYGDNIDKMFVPKVDQAIRKVLAEYGIPN